MRSVDDASFKRHHEKLFRAWWNERNWGEPQIVEDLRCRLRFHLRKLKEVHDFGGIRQTF